MTASHLLSGSRGGWCCCPPLPARRSTFLLWLRALPRRTWVEVRTSWKLRRLSEASRAFSSSALDTYRLTCGKSSHYRLQLALRPPALNPGEEPRAGRSAGLPSPSGRLCAGAPPHLQGSRKRRRGQTDTRTRGLAGSYSQSLGQNAQGHCSRATGQRTTLPSGPPQWPAGQAASGRTQQASPAPVCIQWSS